MENEDILNPAEVRKMLSVTYTTLHRMEIRGELKPAFKIGRGHRRYRRSDVEAYLKNHGDIASP